MVKADFQLLKMHMKMIIPSRNGFVFFLFIMLFKALPIGFGFTSAVFFIKISIRKNVVRIVWHSWKAVDDEILSLHRWNSSVERSFNWIPFVNFSKIDIWQLHWKTRIILLYFSQSKKKPCFYCTDARERKKGALMICIHGPIVLCAKTFKSMAIALRQKVFCIENVTFSIHIDGLDTPPATAIQYWRRGWNKRNEKKKSRCAWFQNNNEFVWCVRV